ncbi:MAG TPA: UvrB/UvrC motif-containing protein [Gemmatimonadales bacterium]|nr:UvrB/UvrC motif-containing protein [Gemmatimonadales bacterium]
MIPCEQCGERPAAIHLKTVADNEVREQHLCEVCAAELGVQTEASVAKFPLGDFLASMGKGASAQLPAGRETGRCDACGATLQDFRDTGRLGCPQCYVTFEATLRTLLRRIHGASRHVGPAYRPPEGQPVPAGTAPEPRLDELRAQLRRAVADENFELAARLRDRIRELE